MQRFREDIPEVRSLVEGDDATSSSRAAPSYAFSKPLHIHDPSRSTLLH
jgi:hypothetical protein